MYLNWSHHLLYECLHRIMLSYLYRVFVLARIFSISHVVDERKTTCIGQLKELFCFNQSGLLSSLALTSDEHAILVKWRRKWFMYSSLSTQRKTKSKKNLSILGQASWVL